MKITTVEQVLDLAEMLNKIMPDNVETSFVIKGIKDEVDIYRICQQEKGNYFEPDTTIPHYWGVVKLGKLEFVLQTEDIEDYKLY